MGAAVPNQPYLMRKTVTFDGNAGNGATGSVNLFTVSGLSKVVLIGHCTVSLVSAGGGSVAAGTAASTTGLITTTTATSITSTNNIWRDASPAALEGAAAAQNVTGNIILTITTGAITAGTIEFLLEVTPYSTGASVVPA